MHISRLSVSKSIFASILLTAGTFACSHIPVQEIPITANSSDEIGKLEAARSQAVAAQVDVFSPEYFQDASAALKNAQQSRASGDDTKKILGYVAEGNAYLAKANEVAVVAKTSMGPVVAARADALAADAPKFLKKDFEEADVALKSATEDVEEGELNAASASRAALAKRYEELEVKAIKIDKLATAEATVQKAENEGAKEIASRTLKEAKASLADANTFISANRHDKAGITMHADAANAQADRVLDVTRQAKVAGKTDAESVVLDREKQKGKLDAETAAAAVTTAELGAANAKSAALTKENSEMNAEKAAEASLDAAKAQFTSAEADVYRDGNRLIIRMKTIAFPSGKATLQPASFPILGKVQRVIQDLNASHVTVEGHTDTVGIAAANTKLSVERASAIGTYLAANGYAAANISTVGLGDSKPLTSNKTKEGRAQNRRVDVIIEPQVMH